MTLSEKIQKIYDGEINFRIESFYDSGWTLQVGDHINGFPICETFDTFDEAIDYLYLRTFKSLP